MWFNFERLPPRRGHTVALPPQITRVLVPYKREGSLQSGANFSSIEERSVETQCIQLRAVRIGAVASPGQGQDPRKSWAFAPEPLGTVLSPSTSQCMDIYGGSIICHALYQEL